MDVVLAYQIKHDLNGNIFFIGTTDIYIFGSPIIITRGIYIGLYLFCFLSPSSKSGVEGT